MDPNNPPSEVPQTTEKVEPKSTPPQKEILSNSQQSTTMMVPIKPKSKKLLIFLRILVVGGGLFGMLTLGLGISFSACFTIKGPPPPSCGPVSFVSLILMPGASLLFLIPLARKIK